MKIFFCDNRLGGLLGFRIDIIRHFINEGHDVRLVVPKPKSQWDTIGDKNIDVRIHYIEMKPYDNNPINDIILLYKYYTLFKKEEADIIFNYTIKPNIYACLAARILGIKAIDIIAGLGYVFSGKKITQRIGRQLYRLGTRQASRVLVLNSMNRDTLINHGFVKTKKNIILLNAGEGINLETYPYIEPDFNSTIRFLMVSRVLYDKGYQVFVNAAKVIKKKYSNVEFELLGPIENDNPMGVPSHIIENDVNQGFIKYLGVTNNVLHIMSRSGVIVVLPSFYGEGMNRSLMEACAIGRPIITTDNPGCKEMVINGKNGIIIPSNDTNAFINAIEKMLELSAEMKNEMSRLSRKIAIESFNVNNVIKVYEELLNM